MLHSLSRAAIEHAETRGLVVLSGARASGSLAFGFGHSTSTGLSEEHSELSEEEEEFDVEPVREEKISCCYRLALCIGYFLPTWGHLSLANVGRSWAAGAFALWHCFMFLNSTILIFINCTSGVLRCYIQWFSEMREGGNPFVKTGAGNFVAICHFFGAFFRSYLLISVGSDLMRFTYLLCVDAWRPDAFEAYRRLVVSDAWKEIAVGQSLDLNQSRMRNR
ncbi:unnamed protein product [Cladocopium goreaui]|uniref:Serine/threonine-protein phosphatase 2A 65 kDa regulatory subunit A beta isoform n=1 Tax=Cladocopium goreaui TaxID=2562237 RepID=A0A9P1CR49_9DINO|nr:unnamed protein product [Cladocopium goreaui]